MKWILILAAAVLLLLGVWFFVGGPGRGQMPEDARRTLEIPSATQGKPALIKAAQQFLSLDLRSVYIQDASELIRIVAGGLDDEDWPSVQAAIFRGWTAVHSSSETRETLGPVLDVLLNRFAQFGSAEDLGTLIELANGAVYWKPTADLALLRAVSKEVPAAAAEKSPLMAILTAAVAKRDYERASTYVSKARFEAGVPDAVRAPVVRLEASLRLYHEARGKQPAMKEVIRTWHANPADLLSPPILLAIGVDLAKSGQASLDYGKLKQALSDSKEEPGSKEYWEKTLVSYGDSLPPRGAYMEAPSLEALGKAVGEDFHDKAAEVRFWKSVAEKSPGDTPGEGMWRVECLKKAFRASSDPREKVGLLKDIAQGYRKHMPGAAKSSVEALVKEFPEAGGRPEVAAILADAAKATAKHELGRKKMDQELAQLPTRTTVEHLKRQLADAKAHQGSPALIATIEKQIKELERKLTE